MKKNKNKKKSKILNKIVTKWNDVSVPSKIEWGLLIFILLFCYINFNHGDITATSTHGMDLLTLIFKGHFFNFYDYTESTAIYLIPLYLFFAIWSIPVFIIFKIFNIPIWGKLAYDGINFPLLMWYKLMPVLFCIGTAYVLYKIATLVGINKNKRKWMMFVFMSFPILVFSQFIFGQYDSLSMFFTTLALYYFMQKKYYKFSLIMSLSVTLKLFPIFIFIPLILLVEKRVVHLIKYCAIALSGLALSNILFIGSKAFGDAKAFSTGMFDRFFLSGISTHYGVVSFFILIFAGVCVFTYLKKIDEKNNFEFYQWTTYIGLVMYSTLFMFILWHPQWVLILTPFIILSAFMNTNLKVSVIINILSSIGYMLLTFNNFPKNVDENLVNYGIIPKIFNRPMYNNGMLSDFFNRPSFLNGNVFITIFFGSLLINLILKYPTEKRIKENSKEIEDNDIKVERGYFLTQLFTILVYIVPTLYLYFISYR